MRTPICMCPECKAAINWDKGEGRPYEARFVDGLGSTSLFASYGIISVWAVSLEDATAKAKAKLPPLARLTDVWRSYRCLFETFSPTYSIPYDL